MTFDIKKFLRNLPLLSGLILTVIISLVVSILISKEMIFVLGEKPLDEHGGIRTNKLIISEVMADNDGVYTDSLGGIYDWVELYNGSDEPVLLHNFGLSDVLSRVKWSFPDVTLGPKEYLVVQLSSENRNGLYANFSLKKNGGETLVLTNANGAVIDALDVHAVPRHHSLARDKNGQWNATSLISPGYENSQQGHAAFMQSQLQLENSLRITEYLANNQGNFIDSFGQFSGFVELTNVSDQTIDVSGYYLGNSRAVPYRYRLPQRILGPNESIVVYTSNRNLTDSELHANFSLSSEEGTIVLSNQNGKIIDLVSYEQLINGFSRQLIDDVWVDSSDVSPGYPNTVVGVEAFATTHMKPAPTLQINELMSRNYLYLAQNMGEFYDWVELINLSDEPIQLNEYTLSTSKSRRDMYVLPDVVLQPNQTYVIMASGEERLTNPRFVHANFKISDIDSIYLYKDGIPIDSVFVADIPVNYSYGRVADGGFAYFAIPTPNAPNGTGRRVVASTPTVSLPSGVYNQVDSLTVSVESTSPVYYTTDGSVPTTSSQRFVGPIEFDKTTVFRFRAIENDRVASEIRTMSYIVNENHTLPVMSLALNSWDLNYLQGNPWVEGIEVPVAAEFFEEEGKFSVNAGLKLFGGSARGFAKKSFQLKFKGMYKDPTLMYHVFENRDFVTFDSLVLRSGSQDHVNALFRDVLGTSLADGMMEVDVQAYKATILYINGRYWGIYNLREKVDEDFVSAHYDVDDRANVVRIDNVVSSGSAVGYNSMIQYAINNDLTQPHHYEYMKSRLDMESYVDFWVASTITTNNDIINARFFNHPDIFDGRWRMIWYDLDFAMYNFDRDYLKFATQPEGMTGFKISTALFRNLVVNPEFQQLFVERLSLHMRTTFHPDRVNQAIDDMVALYQPEMARNQQRWGLTVSHWEKSVEDLRRYFQLRNRYMIAQTKEFFNLTNEEVEFYFGGL